MSKLKEKGRRDEKDAVFASRPMICSALPLEKARSGKCEHCNNESITEFGGIYGDCRFCGWQRVLPVPDKFR